MFAQKLSFRLLLAAMAAACCVSMTASADTVDYDRKPMSPGPLLQPSGPSANNDAFKKVRAQCETEVPSGKANGDICVEAAMLLVSGDIPDDYREVNEDLRIKFALRLLERGVDSSNLARGRAYDWYDKVGFLGMSSYADPNRARELMDMMIKSGYPGGILRKVRGSTSLLAFTATEAERREGCATAKKMLSEGKLDGDNTKLAKEIVESGTCTGFEPVKQ